MMLQRSEQELSDFFENSAVGLHWVGPDGVILRANRAELAMLGYAPEEYLGRHISEFHVQQDVIEDILARLAQGETIQSFPAQLRCKNGSIRDVRISSNGLFKEDRFVHSRCFTLDVTEQNRAEAALRESEERFRTLADAAPVLIWMSGPNKEGIYFNQTWLKFTGKPADEQLGDGWLQLVHPDDRQPLYEVCLDGFRNRRPFTAEFRLLRSDGQYRWLLDTGSPRFDSGGEFVGFIGSCVDIDDRKHAEDALRESEHRFRLMADSAPALVWISGADKQCTWFNRPWLEFVGRSMDEEIGSGWTENVHPDDYDRCLEEYSGAFDARVPFSMEYRLRRYDGEYRWVLDNGVPRYGSAGEFAGYIGSCIDITGHKEIEEALKAKEAELQLVAETTPLILSRCSRDLRYLFVNRAAAALFKRTPDEIVGRPIVEIMGEKAFDVIKPYLDRVLAGESVEFEAEVPYQVIGPRWVRANYTPDRDMQGNVVGWIASIVDITKRKKAEEALRESENRFRTLADAVPALVWAARADGAIYYLNPRWESYTGQTIEDALGVGWSEALHPDERETLLAQWRRCTATGEVYEGECRYRRHDGVYRRHFFRALPSYGPNGKPLSWYGMSLDIEDRKRVEEALRESEQRYRAIVEGQVEMVCRFRPDGEILFVNGAYARRRGTTPDALVGESLWDFVSAEDRDFVRSELDRLRPDSPETRIENRFETAEGVSWTLWTNRGLEFDASGRAVEVQASGIDITDRKQAEEALRRHSVETQTLLETLPIGVLFAHDPECRRITGNPAAYKMTRTLFDGNVSKSAPSGEQPTHFRICRQGVEIPVEQLPVQRAARGEMVHDEEFELVFDDNSVVNFLMSCAALKDESGDTRGVVASMLDVTDRKRMERSLKFLADASKTLSSLVDFKSTLQQVAHLAVPHFADWCAVDILDGDELQRVSVAHVDPAKVRLAEELHRRYPTDLNPEAPRGAMRVLRTGQSEMASEISDSMLVEAARDPEVLRIMRELGLKSYICVPLSAKGKTQGVITFVSAESGRRYGPDDLALAEELALRAAIAIENARLYQEVRDADRRKDEFLAMLAHELRNPLAPIQSGLDILGMEKDQDSDTIGLMREQVQHLVRLVDDLLDVARIVRGRIELKREIVDLSTIVSRSVEAVRSSTESLEQKLMVTMPDETIWLNADPVRLVQVLENLLNNAAKYTDSRGRIELIVERQGGQAVIQVCDTGIGMEPELLPKVFQLFTQSPRSLDRSQGGLGIGLTLVRRLVEMHGGTITAYSAGAGQGSTFTVRLPVASSPGARSEHPTERPMIGQGRRILVVDDNVGAAKMLATLLTRLGDHVAETVHDGPSALEKTIDWRPDIVFLDIGLPGMDGYEAATLIRQRRELDGVLLVALTGYGQYEDRLRSKEAGFDMHLVKPVQIAELEKALSEYRTPAS
jgi:PAS domain S-box-containing protein